MDRFNDKLPAESVVLTFDFTRGLAPGEILVGTPVVTFTNLYGGDTNPAALMNGVALIGAARIWDCALQQFVMGLPNTAVLVPIIGGIDLNDYVVNAACPTSNVQKVLAWPGILPVRQYPSFVGNRL